MGSRRRSIRRDSETARRTLSLRGTIKSALSGKRSENRRRLVFETLGQRRVLAVITGSVFHDTDGSMRAEQGEQRLESRLAYIDANDNAQLDSGERYELADQDGVYRFDDVETGIHPVRLFDGSKSQRQTFPVEATSRQLAPQLDLSEAVDAARADDTLHIATSTSLVLLSTSGTSAQIQSLPFSASAIVAPLVADSGQKATLVLGDAGSGSVDQSGLWLVRPLGNEPELLFSGTSVDATVGNDGYGLVVEYQDDQTLLHSLHAPSIRLDDQSGNLISVAIDQTPQIIPAQAQVLASGSAINVSANAPELPSSRSVVAWPVATSGNDGQSLPALQTSLWDNRSADWVEGSQTVIVGATELLSFDDEAGLLAIRNAGGHVSVVDVDANFAELQRFDDIHGRAQFVADFDALATINQSDSGNTLTLRGIQNAQELGSVDLGATPPQAVIAGSDFASYFALSSTGVSKISFRQSEAHRVEVTQANEVYQADFGVHLDQPNTPPVTEPTYSANALEDTALTINPSQIAQVVNDDDGDRLIPLIVQAPTHGSVDLSEEGVLTYQPNADYFGADSFSLRFHDGQSVSSPIAFSLNVAGQPDPPSGIIFSGGEIPEHTEGPYVVGSLRVADVDYADGYGDDYQLAVFDPRFDIRNGNLVLVDGPLNYEFEPVIYMAVAGVDRQTGIYFSQDIVVRVGDENDPVTQLVIGGSEVDENVAGAYIARLSSYDEDRNQPTIYSVDDDRFEIRNDNELWLKHDESLDHETEPVLVMTVSARDDAGSSISKEFELQVKDQPEYGGSISLSNETVMELHSGATVGNVTLDSVSQPEGYTLAVNDSRFEIDGATLKLIDDVYVRYSAAQQIELTITAYVPEGESSSIDKTFLIEVLEDSSPFHNDENPYDVDGNGTISPSDALRIINYLNIYGPGPVGPGDPGFGYDVNGDGQVTALDALLIINILNTLENGGTVGGEATRNPTAGNDQTPKPLPSSQDDETTGTGPANHLGGAKDLSLSGTDEAGISGPRKTGPKAFWTSDSTIDPFLSSDEAREATDWLRAIRDEEDAELAIAIDELILLLERSLR